MSTITRVTQWFVVCLILSSTCVVCAQQADPEPPSADDYLKRELAALLKADRNELSEAMQRIRDALSDKPEAKDLRAAWYAEFTRAVAEASKLGEIEFPPLRPIKMPDGDNGWSDYKLVCEKAAEAEKEVGYGPYGGLRDRKQISPEDATVILKTTAEVQSSFSKAFQAAHATPPDYGINADFAEALLPLAVWRMLAVRVHSHLALEDRKSAATEAKQMLAGLAKVEFGAPLISELFATVAWTVVLEPVVMIPDWSAEELGNLLDGLTPRPLRPDWLLFGEAAYMESMAASREGVAENPADEAIIKAAVELAFESVYMTHGDVPLAELLRLAIAESTEVFAARVKAAQWVRKNPGDVADAAYCRRLLEQLPEGEAKSWRVSLGDALEPGAVVIGAKLKLAWLRGDRGETLKEQAAEFGRKFGYYRISVEADAVVIDLNPEHPLHRNRGAAAPFCKVTLSKD